MVEPVAALLNGRGHQVIRARRAGLDDEIDSVIVDYADVADLVVVTFDPDFRGAIRRRGGRCLHVRDPERTARDRVAQHYREIVDLFSVGARLVTLPRNGPPRRDQ